MNTPAGTGGNVVDVVVVVVGATAVVEAAAVVGAAVDGVGTVELDGAVLVAGGGVGGVVAATAAPAAKKPPVNTIADINKTIGFIGGRAYR